MAELLRVAKVILLNKDSGIPLIFRSYEEPTSEILSSCESDEENTQSKYLLISAFISAILCFAEYTNQDHLSDIGLGHERYFVFQKQDLIISTALRTSHTGLYPFKRAVKMADEISNRLFDAYFLLESLKTQNSKKDLIKSDFSSPIHEITEDFELVVDNIVIEGMLNQFAKTDDILIKQALARMSLGSSYVSSSFVGHNLQLQTEILNNLIALLKNPVHKK